MKSLCTYHTISHVVPHNAKEEAEFTHNQHAINIDIRRLPHRNHIVSCCTQNGSATAKQPFVQGHSLHGQTENALANHTHTRTHTHALRATVDAKSEPRGEHNPRASMIKSTTKSDRPVTPNSVPGSYTERRLLDRRVRRSRSSAHPPQSKPHDTTTVSTSLL